MVKIVESEYNESDLLQDLSLASKRESAFKELVNRTAKPLYNIIRRQVSLHNDADDILQNTYVKVYKGLPSFKGKSKLMTWMTTIAINETRNHLRKKKLTVPLDDQNEAHIENTQGEEEIMVALYAAIDKLPARQRQIFIMRYFAEKSYKEISQDLSISQGAAKASYHHAMNKIKSELTSNSVYG